MKWKETCELLPRASTRSAADYCPSASIQSARFRIPVASTLWLTSGGIWYLPRVFASTQTRLLSCAPGVMRLELGYACATDAVVGSFPTVAWYVSVALTSREVAAPSK